MKTFCATKNFGDAFASPGFYFDQAQLVFLLGGLFCFLFGCHVNYSPFPLFMDRRNGLLLRLFECIESIKSEVKQKMKHTERWRR